MNLLEALERLCLVVRMQSEIIQKQAEVIEQCKISEEVTDELRKMRNTAESEQKYVEKYFN